VTANKQSSQSRGCRRAPVPCTFASRPITALLFALSLVCTLVPVVHASDRQTALHIIIVYGIPGHAAIHLQQGQRQLFWDPGGFYGTEYDDCVADASPGACQRFKAFPWEQLKTSRRHDVFLDDTADLMQILSIYHLDGDPWSEIYTVPLSGPLAERAWRLIADGAQLGARAGFQTDRQPMFCAKAVADYLAMVGGPFDGLPRPWLPRAIANELRQRGIRPAASYSLSSPVIRRFINATRLAANLPVMFAPALGDDQTSARPSLLNELRPHLVAR
jgi:hypothetical protein